MDVALAITTATPALLYLGKRSQAPRQILLRLPLRGCAQGSLVCLGSTLCRCACSLRGPVHAEQAMTVSPGCPAFAAMASRPHDTGLHADVPIWSTATQDACTEAVEGGHLCTSLLLETDASCTSDLETAQAAPRGTKPSLLTRGSSEDPSSAMRHWCAGYAPLLASDGVC